MNKKLLYVLPVAMLLAACGPTEPSTPPAVELTKEDAMAALEGAVGKLDLDSFDAGLEIDGHVKLVQDAFVVENGSLDPTDPAAETFPVYSYSNMAFEFDTLKVDAHLDHLPGDTTGTTVSDPLYVAATIKGGIKLDVVSHHYNHNTDEVVEEYGYADDYGIHYITAAATETSIGPLTLDEAIHVKEGNVYLDLTEGLMRAALEEFTGGQQLPEELPTQLLIPGAIDDTVHIPTNYGETLLPLVKELPAALEDFESATVAYKLAEDLYSMEVAFDGEAFKADMAYLIAYNTVFTIMPDGQPVDSAMLEQVMASIEAMFEDLTIADFQIALSYKEDGSYLGLEVAGLTAKGAIDTSVLSGTEGTMDIDVDLDMKLALEGGTEAQDDWVPGEGYIDVTA